MIMLRITALMDNKPSENKALIAEHGLSLLAQYGDRRILFDCGSGANTLKNAHRLGLDLKNLDAVVLSHSHYDHAGGFRYLAEHSFDYILIDTPPLAVSADVIPLFHDQTLFPGLSGEICKNSGVQARAYK